ncbi:MAG: HAMP domain-containing protein, partial [Chloroflexi bacterium]|nr:HAMP domain-containing protein [Chloroflexota bacterium]
MTIVAIIGFTLGRQGVYTHTQLHLQSVAELKAGEVTNWLALQRAGIERVIYPDGNLDAVESILSSDASSGVPGSASDSFEATMQSEPFDPADIEGIVILDSSGRVKYSSSSATTSLLAGHGGHMAELPTEGVGLDILRSHHSGSSLVFRFPTRSQGQGVVASVISGPEFRKMLHPDSGLGPKSDIFLVAPDQGTVSFDSIDSLIDAPLLDDLAIVTQTGNLTIADLGGQSMAALHAPMQGFPWEVVVAIPTADAFADVKRMLNLIILSMAAVGSIGAFLAWRFSVTITEPLKQLVAGTEEIRRGNLDYRLDVRSRDEIGDLAGAFTHMSAGLKQAQADLVA